MDGQFIEEGLTSLYVDIKPRLSIAQFAIHGNIHNPSNIGITEDRLSITSKEKFVSRIQFNDFLISPQSCNGLKFITPNELQWRMQISEFKGKNVTDEDYFELLSDSAETQNLDIFKHCVFMAKCLDCDEPLITREQPFSRVMPLPTDDWKEIVENLYCCKLKANKETSDCCSSESPDQTNGKQASLLCPQLNECFVSENYFLLNIDELDAPSSNLLRKYDKILCPRCHQFHGEQVKYGDGSSSLKIDLHRLRLMHSPTLETSKLLDNCRNLSTEVHISHLILSEAKLYKTFRFIIECKTDGKYRPFILIWLMDQEAHICSTRGLCRVNVRHVSSSKSSDDEMNNKCVFSTEWTKSNISIDESEDEVFTSPHKKDGRRRGRKRKECVSKVNDAPIVCDDQTVNLEPVVKILYNGCVKGMHEDLSNAWSKDYSIHSIELPQKLCEIFLSRLISSTKSLPPSLRYLNGFHLGHARR